MTPYFPSGPVGAKHLQDQMSCGKKCVIHAPKDNMIAAGQCHLTDQTRSIISHNPTPQRI